MDCRDPEHMDVNGTDEPAILGLWIPEFPAGMTNK
jgi:hypothetical protein